MRIRILVLAAAVIAAVDAGAQAPPIADAHRAAALIAACVSGGGGLPLVHACWPAAAVAWTSSDSAVHRVLVDARSFYYEELNAFGHALRGPDYAGRSDDELLALMRNEDRGPGRRFAAAVYGPVPRIDRTALAEWAVEVWRDDPLFCALACTSGAR